MQETSGVRTSMLPWHWIGRVLGGAAQDSHARGEPMLSALCVHADGTIGEGYGKAILENPGGPLADDLDMHAAVERLKCHQFFGADLPPDGGTAALLKSLEAAIKRRRIGRAQAVLGRYVPHVISCFR